LRETRLNVSALLLLLAALAAGAPAGGATQRGRAQAAEQTSFGAEVPVRRPATLPKDVLRALARDERVRGCFGERPGSSDDVGSLFGASEVRLGGASGRASYVVVPKEPCLFGANIAPFWVFAPAPRGGHRLVLKTHALGLEVGRRRTRGYRDIRISAASAAVVYESGFEFDGRRYVPRWCRSQSIEEAQQPGRGKFRYYPCADAEKPY
jgi:hypothetical protein